MHDAPTRSFIPALHALRGIAALGVLLFHWNAFFRELNLALPGVEWAGVHWQPFRLINFGWLGVPLFFLLSGYLLGGKLLARELDGPALKRYWVRRFLRIYPAVWLQIPALIAIAWLLPGLIPMPDWSELLRNVTLWIHAPPWMTKPLNGVWWTLPVELSFYLVLPAVVWLVRRIGLPAVLALSLAAAVLWRLWVIAHYGDAGYAGRPWVVTALPGSLAAFVLGLALNRAPRVLGPRGSVAALAVAGIAYLALTEWLVDNLATYWVGDWMFVVWDPAMYLVLATALYVVIHGNAFARALSRPTLVWLGEISFGLYLWHFPVLQVLDRLYGETWDTPAESLLALAVCLTLTIALAALSFHAIERPAMGWGRRLPKYGAPA